MRDKILVITFSMTMTFWFGCAGGGGEQNYKVLEEDRPMLQSEEGPGANDAPGEPGARVDEMLEVNPSTHPQTLLSAETTDRAAEETEPSLNGLDRTSWPTVEVRPEPGAVRHRPVYFSDRSVSADTRPLDREKDANRRLEAALEGTRSSFYDRGNVRDLFVQPLDFALDTILLPINLVRTPPWSVETTPPGPSGPGGSAMGAGESRTTGEQPSRESEPNRMEPVRDEGVTGSGIR